MLYVCFAAPSVCRPSPSDPQLIDESGEPHQIPDSKERPTRGEGDEWVRRHQARPGGSKPLLPAGLDLELHPLPVLNAPQVNDLQAPAMQRMERVRHPYEMRLRG